MLKNILNFFMAPVLLAPLVYAQMGIASELRPPEEKLHGNVQASWYGGGEPLRKHTSNGEVFNPHERTCAHRTLPFGTRIRVQLGSRIVICRVNDRGPAPWTGRSLDVTKQLAMDLGFLYAGVRTVFITILPASPPY